MNAHDAFGLSLAVEARTLGSLWSRQLGGGGGGDMGCAILAPPAPRAAAEEAEILAWGCARSLWVFTSSSSERVSGAPTTASAAEPSAAADEVATAASDDDTGRAALARARREKRERRQAKRRRRNAQRGGCGSAAGGEGGAGEEGVVDVRDVLPGPTRPDARIDTHAEQDAVSDAAKRGKSLRGATAYVTSAPCRTCFALLVNAGVASIVCGDTLERYTSAVHAERMRALARFYGVELNENAAVPPYAGLKERRLRRDGMPSGRPTSEVLI